MDWKTIHKLTAERLRESKAVGTSAIEIARYVKDRGDARCIATVYTMVRHALYAWEVAGFVRSRFEKNRRVWVLA